MFLSIVRSVERKNLEILVNFKKQFSNLSASQKFYEGSKRTTLLSGRNRSFASTPEEIRNNPLFSKTEVAEFRAVFPSLIEEFTKDDTYINIKEVREHYGKMMDYTVTSGQCLRGLTAVVVYKALEPNLTPENILLSRILGWCLEMNEVYIVLLDDVVDNTHHRRGMPAWRLVAKNGDKSIDDACFLLHAAFALLKKHFSHLTSYVDLFHILHTTVFKVNLGQLVDNMSINDGNVYWKCFTKFYHDAIIDNKTGYLVFYATFAAGMRLANITDQKIYDEVYGPLIRIGAFCQCENDYDDCYDHVATRGYNGNDIRLGKLTWLSYTAMTKANPAQQAVMKEHYGKDNEESAIIIRNLYEELELQKEFARQKNEGFWSIGKQIEKEVSNAVLRELCIKTMESVYKMKYY